MRKLLFSFLVLLWVNAASGQRIDSPAAKTSTDYLNKSRKQKTAASWLLGGGAALTIIGTVIVVSEAANNILESDEIGAGEIMAFTGLAAMVGSIPLFIAAGKNKRKAAADVSFKMERTTIARSSQYHSYCYPTLALKIHL